MHSINTGAFETEKNHTHLFLADTYVVSVIDMGVNTQRTDSTNHSLCCYMSVERMTGEMNRKIRVSQVLVKYT